jgi:hypothetical protein
MKIAIAIAVLAMIAVGILNGYGRLKATRLKEEVYAALKPLPPVAKDFTTPEGAILCLEDADCRRDIEAPVTAKGFNLEARLMLQNTGFKDHIDEKRVVKTAEALMASNRAHTTANWPDFEGLESFFTKGEPHSDRVVLVTEVCRFPDGLISQQRILVAETAQGWRALNPVSNDDAH